MKTKAFLNQLQHDEIVAAIQAAEGITSGEIRVFISRAEVDDPVAAAKKQFEVLGMERTQQRNGVLIFVAPVVQRFAVIGDEAIHARCGQDFWSAVADEMSGHFRQAEFTRGIVQGIRKAGEVLSQHFPRRPDDRDELPNKVERD
jgi:uncharacterized membrane protein